jgi:hypothetical protein
MRDSPDQAGHYHFLSLLIADFISYAALEWLQSKKISFLARFSAVVNVF